LIRVSQATPEEHVRQQLLGRDSEAVQVIAVVYDFDQYYLPDRPVVELLALVFISFNADGHETWCGCVGRFSDVSAAQRKRLGTLADEPHCQALANELGWPWLSLGGALSLEPISIKKPWGQEVWFTGIEARGQSSVSVSNLNSPLPWVLSIAPERLTGGLARSLNLLKILDPLPEEVFGDLYFELHEEKQEVYVVTHIDETAWPAGVGGIRFGFDEVMRQRFASDTEFKQAFANAVSAYERVRREIDLLMDVMRNEQGLPLNEAVMASQTKAWLEHVPAALRDKEVRLRGAMDAFKGLKPLSLGDVVKVPCYTPHSLLHGVRTIEFQTPVYERQILSFAQKVLTQERWDTAAALACVQLDTPDAEPLKRLDQQPGVTVDEVVRFDDFEVWRIKLTISSAWALPEEFAYALVMGLSGRVSVGELCLSQEQGALLPGALAGQSLSPVGADAVFLLALPR